MFSDHSRSCIASLSSFNCHHHFSFNVRSWDPISVACSGLFFFAFTSCVAHHKSKFIIQVFVITLILSWFKMWNFVQDDFFASILIFWKHYTKIFFWLLSFNFVPSPSLGLLSFLCWHAHLPCHDLQGLVNVSFILEFHLATLACTPQGRRALCPAALISLHPHVL